MEGQGPIVQSLRGGYWTRTSKNDKEIRLSLKDHREIRPYDKHGKQHRSHLSAKEHRGRRQVRRPAGAHTSQQSRRPRHQHRRRLQRR